MNRQQIKSDNKKVNLRVWISIKIIPALLVLAYYWMCVRGDFKPIYTFIQYLLLAITFAFLLIIKKKRDVFDEFAKETLYKTDSICLKISYVIMGIILIPSTFINPSAITIGYLLAIGILVLTILRAIIFCIIDKRGI